MVKIALMISMLIALNINIINREYIESFKADFVYKLENQFLKQAEYILNGISQSVYYEVSKLENTKDKTEITELDIIDILSKHSNFELGGDAGTIFAINLRSRQIIFDNSNQDLSIDKKLYKIFPKISYKLLKRINNNPEDRLYFYNEPDNQDKEFLVCKILPLESIGFNGLPRHNQNSFQIKLCQRVNQNNIISIYNSNILEAEKYFRDSIFYINIIIGLFILAIIMDRIIKKLNEDKYEEKEEFKCPYVNKNN